MRVARNYIKIIYGSYTKMSVIIGRSRLFKYSLMLPNAASVVFGIKLAESEEVILQLIPSMSVLLYGLEAYPLNVSLRYSIGYVINSLS